MPRPLDQLPPDATSLARRIQALERAVTELRASRRLEHSSLTGTAITVYDGDGVTRRGAIGIQPDGTLGLVAEGGPAPTAPTPPLVTPSIGGLRVAWNGGLADSGPLPADFDHVAVHVSTTSGFTPNAATFAGTITRSGDGGMLPVTPLPYQTHYVVLVAVNSSGNASAPSAQTSATPLQVGGVDLSTGSVGLGALGGPAFDLASQRYVDAMADPTAWKVLATATGSSWDFLTGVTDAPTGKTVAQATGYTVARGTVQIPYDPDTLYRISARVRTTAASVSGTDTVYVGLLGVAADGVTLVNRTGAAAFTSQHYVAASNAPLPNGSGWTVYTGYVRGRAATGTGGTAPDPRSPGVLQDLVRFVSPILYLNFGSGTSGNTGTMQIDAVSVEALKTGSVDTINLVDGSVTAPAIRAGSVKADKLEAILQLVTRLVAGNPAGARVELNADGLRVYNSSGQLVIRFDSADGSAAFTGNITGSAISGGSVTGSTVQTSAAGQRIVVGTDNQIKLYSGNGRETAPGYILSNVQTDAGVTSAYVIIGAPSVDGAAPQTISLSTSTDGSRSASIGGFHTDTYPDGSQHATVQGDLTVVAGGLTVLGANGDQTSVVGGMLTPGNMAWGRATINAAANTPTSVAVTGLNVKGDTFDGLATYNGSAPGTQITGVAISSMSATSATVWVTRTSAAATSVSWMVIGRKA
ncbi:hypothetical protein [Streptomyces sp. NPDC021356]|uniref:hypothetical protein n=1 Tax=Streptomyces sp. NPDC021356 TaxID=3154900 RepID=UPI0033C3DC93